MKTLRFFIVILVALIVSLITLLGMAIYHTNYSMEDSIVFIESTNSESRKEGMGFTYKVLDDDSYIVTNYHVVESSNSIYVYNLDNKKERAELVDFDSYTDIAILKIDNDLDLKEVKISSKSAKVNDEVYYYNINNKVIKNGSILCLDNEINISANYGNSYYKAGELKADIASGNSGGPLFNNKEEVVGLISLKEENKTNGYYIPIKDVMNIVTKLENRTLVRPNIGGVFISSSNIDALNQNFIEIPNISGVVVVDVAPDYPLSIAGFIKGDVITKIDDVTITDVIDMQKEIYSHDVGDTVTVEYYRYGILNTASVVLNK